MGMLSFPLTGRKHTRITERTKGGEESAFEIAATTARSKVRGMNRMPPAAGLRVVAVPVIHGG